MLNVKKHVLSEESMLFNQTERSIALEFLDLDVLKPDLIAMVL